MKRFAIILSCCVALTATFAAAREPVSSERPNIVFILADDLGYGDVQCLNPERGKIPTPHMDKIAADGMTFLD
jgi:arylsulfatase A-like enzyme